MLILFEVLLVMLVVVVIGMMVVVVMLMLMGVMEAKLLYSESSGKS